MRIFLYLQICIEPALCQRFYECISIKADVHFKPDPAHIHMHERRALVTKISIQVCIHKFLNLSVSENKDILGTEPLNRIYFVYDILPSNTMISRYCDKLQPPNYDKEHLKYIYTPITY